MYIKFIKWWGFFVQDINLHQLLKFYTQKWFWIVLVTIIGVATGYVYNTYVQTPLYKSSATLILVSPGEKRSTQDVTLINNYIQLFKSRRVLEPVISEQNLSISYDTLVQSIEATNEKNTEVIKVSISTPDANTSRALVEGSVASFKEQAKNLYDLDNVRLVDGASNPERPYNVFKETILAASGAIGFITSVITLFFVYDYRLTHKPKRAIIKNKPTLRQRFTAIFHRKKPADTPKAPKPVKKKPTLRKKAKTKTPTVESTATPEQTPLTIKKPAPKKSAKRSRKGK